ncbi:Transcription factor bye1 [Microbotryomycetes sp. JL201]|nr:Transcription factor bye1 [Microbotryomycetes sp. JL201]
MGRTRQPSVRALEAQRDAYEALAADAEAEYAAGRRRTTRTAGAKRQRPQYGDIDEAAEHNVDDDGAHEHDAAAAGPSATEQADQSDEEQEVDTTLYCICLGPDTGEQPMIQCEACDNWFHFGCIGMDKERAKRIESYVCDVCHEMGLGTTITLPAAKVSKNGAGSGEGLDNYNGDADGELPADFAEELGNDNDDDDDEYMSESQHVSRRAESGSKTSRSKRAKPRDGSMARRVSGSGQKRSTRHRTASPEEEEFDNSDDDEDEQHERKRPRPSKKASQTQEGGDGPLRDVTTDDKTRTHCRNQLKTIFTSIFASADAVKAAEGVEDRAASFAKEVEQELFEGFAEVEKNIRAPRQKYLTKFRSLHFNLRTNAVFRSRVASNELTPNRIVNMSADDLLTPELKAMADSVRAASLKHSVKEALAAPTAKRTHKGEEAIESTDVAAFAEEEERKLAAKAKMEEREQANTTGGEQVAASVDSPRPSQPALDQETSRSRQSSFAQAADMSMGDIGLNREKAAKAEAAEGSRSPRSKSPDTDEERSPPMSRPRQRSNFDMSTILSKIKVPPKSATPEGNDAEAAAEPDPFDSKTSGQDDDFEEALLRGEDGGRRKSATVARLETRPMVWSGDVLVPDEGGFPSVVTQLGGRHVGLEASTWTRLLPKTMSTDGRIPTATAVKYLIECAISPSRELFVLAALPDLSGPTDALPHKPTSEKCLAKYQHVLDFYVKKDRIGVVAPKGELRKTVKDIYLMPLRKDDFLPEYIDLLDEHEVPPQGSRQQDLLLVVIVAQKDLLPTVQRSTTPPIGEAPNPVASKTAPDETKPESSATPTTVNVAPASSAPPPAFDPSLLSKIDPTALNSLLSNPALLQSALQQMPPQQVMSPPQAAASYSSHLAAPVPGQQYDMAYNGHGPGATSASWTAPMPMRPHAASPYHTGGFSPMHSSAANSKPAGNMSPPQSAHSANIHPSRMAMMQQSHRDDYGSRSSEQSRERGRGRGGRGGSGGGGRGRGRGWH